MNRSGWVGVGVLVLWACRAPAQEAPAAGKALSPGNVLAALGGGSVDALAGSLRGVLLKAMPTPLYEDASHWGGQRPVREVHWRGKGLHAHPEPVDVPRNDGRWWRVRVTADRPADTLVLDLREVRQPEAGRMTFTAFLSLDAHVEFERQTWRAGTRLYAGSTRARLRLRLTLRCEATGRIETAGGLLPEAVFRLRVQEAQAGYDNFVVEHIGGVGGEAAKLLGEAAHRNLERWRPTMERDLLARIDAAIVKAGDTREVRLTLSKLINHR
jgi:hypothetical protein